MVSGRAQQKAPLTFAGGARMRDRAGGDASRTWLPNCRRAQRFRAGPTSLSPTARHFYQKDCVDPRTTLADRASTSYLSALTDGYKAPPSSLDRTVTDPWRSRYLAMRKTPLWLAKLGYSATRLHVHFNRPTPFLFARAKALGIAIVKPSTRLPSRERSAQSVSTRMIWPKTTNSV
jgi:hypothetical protein